MTSNLKNIVIVRAPLRISFVGGGSDLPWPKEYKELENAGIADGRTFSCAIDKYVYVAVKKRHDHKIIMNWSSKESCESIHDLSHDLARLAFLEFGITNGVEITTFADVHGNGSGLGSSAATTVALLKAAASLRGVEVTKNYIAEKACKIELVDLEKPGGCQDQYVSAIGGFVQLDHQDGCCVLDRKQHFSDCVTDLFSANFPLFSPMSSKGRSADDILNSIADDLEKQKEFRRICSNLVSDFERDIRNLNFAACAHHIFLHNEAKDKCFGSYQPKEAELLNCLRYHDEKLKLKWKLCGAGGTGHLLVYAPPSRAWDIVPHVEAIWGPKLDWKVQKNGVEVIYGE